LKEDIKDFISLDVDENIKYLKELFEDNSDVVYRDFYIGRYKAATVFIDGMADKAYLDNYVLESVMLDGKYVDDIKDIKDRLLTVADMKAVSKLSDAVNAIMSGESMMFVQGIDSCYIIATRAFPTRGVGEPAQETVIRGGRDSFTEVVRFNTALLRRRIRDTRLKLEATQLGVRSKTDCVITYIDDIVNKEVLDELNRRLDKIKIDAILDSGYVEQYIEDNAYSPFPQVQSTERPDVVAAALYEGRVAVLVDNSPIAIIVPATLPNLFQSPDDYYQRWIFGSSTRILRLIAVFISLIAPALYVAVTSFNPSIIPTKLAYSIAASREGVPFPAFIEALIMEISLALLTEATIRLPKAIGSTIGIVGGLIIGQAAVSAGIVSPIMIIIVSITVLSSFAIPNYQAGNAIRIIRLCTIIASAIIGLYGIMLVLIIMLIHLVRLKSFGMPYLAPAVNTSKRDLKDLIIRLPFKFMKERPDYMNTGDKIRQR
jgi:spore germination protein